MRFYKNILMVILTTFSVSTIASAAPAWYTGSVSRVALISSDGSFIVTLSNNALDDCKHEYAYFIGSELGEGRLKAAYSIALTSITTGKKMGVVIDKSINGTGGQCKATGMTADLRAN